jgi:DNA-binding NtrC family response regulator
MLRKTHTTRKTASMSSPASGRPRSTTRELSPPGREVFPSPAVLVVSTDGLLRWALYEALVAAGFRVLTCDDETQTRDILPKVDVEIGLAIIDEESWQVTARARGWLRAHGPQMPVILLAHPGDDMEERARELQVSFLTKPFDLPHLIETVTCTLHAAARHARTPVLQPR